MARLARTSLLRGRSGRCLAVVVSRDTALPAFKAACIFFPSFFLYYALLRCLRIILA